MHTKYGIVSLLANVRKYKHQAKGGLRVYLLDIPHLTWPRLLSCCGLPNRRFKAGSWLAVSAGQGPGVCGAAAEGRMPNSSLYTRLVLERQGWQLRLNGRTRFPVGGARGGSQQPLTHACKCVCIHVCDDHCCDRNDPV
jgi:hypothetical protein